MASLPIIDLRTFSSISDLGTSLVRAGKNPGFFYVTGIEELNDEAVSPVFDVAARFFNETAPEEKKAWWNGSGDLGYTGLHEERLDVTGGGDVKESFYMSNPGADNDTQENQRLPEHLENGRKELAELWARASKLALHLLAALELALGVQDNYLCKAHTGELSRLRLINYPTVSTQETTDQTDAKPPEKATETNILRAGAHSDYGSLTLLFRQPSDQGGLQVLQNEEWQDVPCVKDTVVVNIGDALEFWTAGRLRSTVHRVVFPRSATENVQRLSIPMFIQPDADVVLTPIAAEAELDSSKPALTGNEVMSKEFADVLLRKGYQSAAPITSFEHLHQRIRSTYGHS